MAGFNYEKDLPHQNEAINAVMDALVGSEIKNGINAEQNPLIESKNKVFDICMQTGTGKTYTFTKMMFELNKIAGVFKFIIAVPTLSIKAGTMSFLNSEATREHFRDIYSKNIKIYLVESIKQNDKKERMPSAISEYARASENNSIHVLVINQGMINSQTLQKEFDVTLFDEISNPFKAISYIRPIVIIDEPHKFAQESKTWENLKKFNAQLTFRYGATFKEFENKIYELNALDAFNADLVKGVEVYVAKFDEAADVSVRLVSTDGTIAKFEYKIDKKSKIYDLAKGDDLGRMDKNLSNIKIEKLNTKNVLLNNGVEMKIGDMINPFTYSQTLQQKMLEVALDAHFKNERELMKRSPRIKPLALFFINDIDSYREKKGDFRVEFEDLIKSKMEQIYKEEEPGFYKDYLKSSLDDISLTHGGYFSKDNDDKDEKIQKEIDEILHDKESLLSFENTRRFIFSKWTLREGWDNPNVFTICKLRSSGSKSSKLQEVGRGLRLPVNEYMARVKDDKFMLNYIVDFKEKDFASSLINEINESVETKINKEELTKDLIRLVALKFGLSEDEILKRLDEVGAINRRNQFLPGGYEKFKEIYLLQGSLLRKIRNAEEKKQGIKIRPAMFSELKELWERLNERVILEYKIKNEEEFGEIFSEFLTNKKEIFKPKGLEVQKVSVKATKNVMSVVNISNIKDEIEPINTLNYKDFLVKLSDAICMRIDTLHRAFLKFKEADIKKYLNLSTIYVLKSEFSRYLLENAISKFSISYNNVKSSVHPTKFTDENGDIKDVSPSDLGVQSIAGDTAREYLFDEIFFDSELEKENIIDDITEVIVFTKIPKNSIKIPVAGGGTYSPDFAYIINKKDGKSRLNFIIETKNKPNSELALSEKQKIKHAQKLFSGSGFDIKFETQFENQKILEVIRGYL
jgi:hypothetical protein